MDYQQPQQARGLGWAALAQGILNEAREAGNKKQAKTSRLKAPSLEEPQNKTPDKKHDSTRTRPTSLPGSRCWRNGATSGPPRYLRKLSPGKEDPAPQPAPDCTSK